MYRNFITSHPILLLENNQINKLAVLDIDFCFSVYLIVYTSITLFLSVLFIYVSKIDNKI